MAGDYQLVPGIVTRAMGVLDGELLWHGRSLGAMLVTRRCVEIS